MILNNDGSFTRDIDIEELSVSFGGRRGRPITLYKDKITYREAFCDSKTVTLSGEDFIKISDQLHNAGLLSILTPSENAEVLDGAVYETMHCVFDDGSHYHYRSRTDQPSDVFKNICDILSEQGTFCSNTND